MIRCITIFLAGLLTALLVLSCTTTPKTGGVYHIVKKGETLWRIAQAYNCDPTEIALINNLPDDTIQEGSVLFIPNAAEPLAITSGTSRTQDSGPSSRPTSTPATEAPQTIREQTLGPAPAEKPQVSTGTPAAPAPETPQTAGKPVFRWPVEGTVSSKFGTYKGIRHNGIKIDAAEGTPVLAAADGTVTYSALMKYFGETIIIKHNDIYSTVYSQLKERNVRSGDLVRQGDRIGLLGAEGDQSPHLSFEIRRKNRARDPLQYLPKKK